MQADTLCSNSDCVNAARMPCNFCKQVWYCSKRCKKTHYNREHVAVCAYLKTANDDTHREDMDFFNAIRGLVVRRDWLGIIRHEICLADDSGTSSPVAIEARLHLCYRQEHRHDALNMAGFFCDALLNCAYYRRSLKWASLYFKCARCIDPQPVSERVGLARMRLAQSYIALGDFEIALRNSEQAMSIFVHAEEHLLLVRAATQLGKLHNTQGAYLKANEVLQNTLIMVGFKFESASNNAEIVTLVADVHAEVSKCYMGVGDFEQALRAQEQHNDMITYLHATFTIHNQHDLTWCHLRTAVLIWAMARTKWCTPGGETCTDLSSVDTTQVLADLKTARGRLEKGLVRAQELVHRVDQEEVYLMLSFVVSDIERVETLLGHDTSYHECHRGVHFLENYLDLATERFSLENQVGLHVRQSSHCHGCFTARESTETLSVCSQCKVARFCNVSCQRRASTVSNFRVGVKHKDICPVLKLWRRWQKVRVVCCDLHACCCALCSLSPGILFSNDTLCRKKRGIQLCSRRPCVPLC